jgi:hypothetical protein
MSGSELLEIADSQLSVVRDSDFDLLLADERERDRRVALLDLVWTLRSLDIANLENPDYIERKRRTRVFCKANKLAQRERRHPTLLWSDIAIYHPINDPRTFLAPGLARDEEILMYRVQFAIEQTFKNILESDWINPNTWSLADLVLDLDAVLKGIMHYSRARTVGQFYQLDPFLGPNPEYRGHATGSFSAWTYLMGIFLSGNRSYVRRLCDETNWKAFDQDAAPYVKQVTCGAFKSLGECITDSQLTVRQREHADRIAALARHRFTLFLHSHRGAIKRHARASFADRSPSEPPKTNAETIREAISDMVVPTRGADTVVDVARNKSRDRSRQSAGTHRG